MSSSTATLKAQSFRESHVDYFFGDAHFLVEASAKAEAEELQHNVFKFDDDSILVISNTSKRVSHFVNLEAFKASLAR